MERKTRRLSLTVSWDMSTFNNWERWIKASQVALMVKKPPANTGDTGIAGSIPGSGRSPGGGHGNPLQCSCPWTEEPGELQSIGFQRVGHDWSNLALRGEWVFKEPEIWEKFFLRDDLVEAMESVSERNKYLALTNIEWSTRWQYFQTPLNLKNTKAVDDLEVTDDFDKKCFCCM